jgi:hypothetical protein
MMANDPNASQPFVSQQDRPNVTADTPISELRVRDLHQILSGVTLNKFHLDKAQQKDIDKIHKDIKEKDFKEIEGKHIKDLQDSIVKNVGDGPFNPVNIGGDPITQISQLQNSVNQLTSEVAQLKAKLGP